MYKFLSYLITIIPFAAYKCGNIYKRFDVGI